MKLPKFGNTIVTVALLASAGFLGMLPMEFVISALLFAALIRGSVNLIEKAINGTANVKEYDQN